MNYTILPKKHIIPTNIIHPTYLEFPLTPYVSHSALYYYNDVIRQLEKLKEKSPTNLIDYEVIRKTTNTYEFLFSKVPGTKFSVSKLKPANNIFYVFLELIISSNVIDYFQNKNIKTIHFTSKNDSTIDCLNMLRDEHNDLHYSYEYKNINELFVGKNIDVIMQNSIDFLYFQLEEEDYSNIENYICGFLSILCNTLVYQRNEGIAIIKLDAILHKPIIEIIYLYTCIYEKVYIVKPNSTNIGNNERFLICKQFNSKMQNQDMLKKIYTIVSRPQTIKNRLHSILTCELPYYFINKIEESNASIGYQQIEQIDQILNIIKNKNKEDKLDNLKKNNIQKCIQWCEKFKIPHNKFVEKNNIFLALPAQVGNSLDAESETDEFIIEESLSMNEIPSFVNLQLELDLDDDPCIPVNNYPC